MMAMLLKAAALCASLTSREVPADRACAFALPAVSQRSYPPELLAAIAVGESRLVVGAVNPATGCWGVMQTCGPRPRRVTAWASVAAGVRKLDDARAYCLRRDRGLVCTIAGYQAGPRGVAALLEGRRWPARRAGRVLRRAARIGAAVERWQVGGSASGQARTTCLTSNTGALNGAMET